MTYISLIIEFFKTGLFAVGGGLATIPFLREIARKHDWFTEDELINMIAVSESTPGPMGVNMATYAGFSASGFWGGIIATLALVLPSVIVVLMISRFIEKFSESRIIKGAFFALRPAAVGLIAGAAYILLTLTVVNMQTAVINLPSLGAFFLFTAVYFLFEYAEYVLKLRGIKLNPIFIILLGAVFGIVFGEYL